jgi:predicted O-methyltransferase YrrM
MILEETIQNFHKVNLTLVESIPGFNYEGGAGPDKKLLMLSYIYSLDAQLVYEIGFNFGGMAAAICMGLQKTGGKYVGFELKQDTAPAFEKLKSLFGVPAEMVFGDSKQTVPARLASGEKPDIVFVDGGHLPEDIKADILNILPCMRKGSLIMIDDVTPLKSAITAVLPENEIIWFENSRFSGPGSAIYQIK